MLTRARYCPISEGISNGNDVVLCDDTKIKKKRKTKKKCVKKVVNGVAISYFRVFFNFSSIGHFLHFNGGSGEICGNCFVNLLDEAMLASDETSTCTTCKN